MVEHLKVLISRAPKGSIYLLGGPSQISNQRAPPDLMVEHLKVMAASRACLRILISRLRTLKVQFTYWPLKLSNQWSSLLTHPY